MTKILLFLGQGCAEVILSTFSFPHRQNASVDQSYKDDIRQISSEGNNHNTFWVIFAGMALNCHLACVAGVKRERGNLGARERARVKGKEPLLPRARSCALDSLPLPFLTPATQTIAIRCNRRQDSFAA